MKKSWHTYLDRVSQGREEVVVTRYSRPVARLCPVDEAEQDPGIFGFLQGTWRIHGDIVAPTGEVWEPDSRGEEAR
ncbi:MAG: type II toxin-antitoxin system prevent-host-death family antitoxin [Gemmatimonadetes bacterium]|nr:type II toxin-antitoxin system prevent-host-death family antitoxin [Gemmatimonadota bacterium]